MKIIEIITHNPFVGLYLFLCLEWAMLYELQTCDEREHDSIPMMAIRFILNFTFAPISMIRKIVEELT